VALRFVEEVKVLDLVEGVEVCLVGFWGETRCKDYLAKEEVKTIAVNTNFTRLVLEIIYH